MIPLKITDNVQVLDGETVREKTVSIFGMVVSKRIERYHNEKERPIGLTSGIGLTYVDDDLDEE